MHYATFWPTICNILTNNYSICNILNNRYNVQYSDQQLQYAILHTGYSPSFSFPPPCLSVKFAWVYESQTRATSWTSLRALQYILTAIKYKTDLNLIDCITMKNDESKNTRVTAPLFLKDPKLKNSFCKRHKVDKRRMCITWPTGNKTVLIQMSPISKCVRHNSQS